MKEKILLAVFLSIAFLVAATFIYKRFAAPPVGTYKWNGLLIQAKAPPADKKLLAAEWGLAQVTLEEIWAHSPELKEKLRKKTDLEQLAYDSEYYFNFLNVAQDLLIEELSRQFAKNENLPLETWKEKRAAPYTSFEIDFLEWKARQNITDSALNPAQKEVVRSDFATQFRSSHLRQYFAEEIKTPFHLFLEPPLVTMEWPTDGVATLGPAKGKLSGLFLCDMISRGCFQALEVLRQVSLEKNIRINFRPALSGDDLYSTLKSQMGICLTKIDAQKFWTFFDLLKGQPARMEEPELYALLKLDQTNEKKVKACMVSPEMRGEWDQHVQFFKTLWNPALPALVLYGEPILGPFSYERVSELIARRGK